MTLTDMKRMKKNDLIKVKKVFQNINIFELQSTRGHDGNCSNNLILIEEDNYSYIFTITQDIYSYDLIRNSVIFKVKGTLKNKKKSSVLKLFNNCVVNKNTFDNQFLERFEKTIPQKISLDISYGKPTTFEDVITTLI